MEEHSSGAIAERLSVDTTHIRGAVGDQIGLLAQNMVTVVACLAISFAAGWRMTLVVTACLPVLGLAAWIHAKSTFGINSKVVFNSELYFALFCLRKLGPNALFCLHSRSTCEEYQTKPGEQVSASAGYLEVADFSMC